MNACRKNRKRIAWLAAGALEAQPAQELRAHVQQCQGCRGYLAEISAVTTGLKAPNRARSIEPSFDFHQRFLKSLRRVGAKPQRLSVMEALRLPSLNWRVTAVAVFAVLVLLYALPLSRHHAARPGLQPSKTEMASATRVRGDTAPTFSNYRLVANQSLDQLDELISRQAHRSLPRTLTYTVMAAIDTNLTD